MSPTSCQAWSLSLTERQITEAVRSCCEAELLDDFIIQAAYENATRIYSVEYPDWRSVSFLFASILLGHHSLQGLEDWQVVQVADAALAGAADSPLFADWSGDVGDGWPVLGDCDSAGSPMDPREDFIACWSKIQTPLQMSYRPENAVPLAERYPLESDRWPSWKDRRYRMAVSICYWYARLVGEHFYLSGNYLGRLLGVSQRQASEYLRRAESEGVLEITLNRGRATRHYRFKLDSVATAADDLEAAAS